MFCQSCGAENTENARFCNMCGAKIAAPGTPGGMIAASTQQGMAEEGSGATVKPVAAQPVGVPAESAPAESAQPESAQPESAQPESAQPESAPATAEPSKASDSHDPAPETSGAQPVQKAGTGTLLMASEEVSPNASNPDPPKVSALADTAPAPGGTSSPNENVWEPSKDGPHPQPMGHMPTSTNTSMASVSLAAIGVQSSKKVWTVVVLIALSLVAIGAAATYFVMANNQPEVAVADPVPEMEMGLPLPEGMEEPEVDFVAGGGPSSSPASSAMNSTGGSGSGSSMRTGSRPSSSGAMASSSMTSSSMTSSMSTSSMSNPSTTSMTGSTMSSSSMSGTTMTSPTTMTGTGTSGSGNPSTMSGGQTAGGGQGTGQVPTGEEPEGRDIEMELYAYRVRYVIQRYYASRARSCFEHASRNTEGNVSGRVVIGFTIGSDGQVTRSSVRSNGTGVNSLGTCLANNVRSWRLPAPPEGSLTMEMPFSA
ncbi:MAG: AgmX/PglI C-terminal domain-containing protein [Myxococcota bacterium]